MIDIVWDNPGALYFLWILVPLLALIVHAHKKRRLAASQFADVRMVDRIIPMMRTFRVWGRGILFLTGVTCLVVATARPRWGVYFENVAQRGADVMVLLDVSRSMLSRDVVPSRLERAKSDIRDLLRELVGERIGLVAFAGRASLVCPLTVDHGFFKTILDDVGPDSAPRGGSMIGDAIREALASMEDRRDRDQAILVITDGEDQDSYPKEAAQAAAERGVKIFTIGLGDPEEGSRIPVEDASGNLTFMKHEGQEVWSRMDEDLLQEIAHVTGAVYVRASTRTYDLGEVYREHLSKLSGGEVETQKRKRYREQFQMFVLLALLLFLGEMLVSPYPRREMGKLSLLSVLLLFLWAPWAHATDAVDLVKQGIERYRAGELEAALDLLREADVALPEDPRIDYDTALVHQAQGDASLAAPLYEGVAASRDKTLAAHARYNLGTLDVDKAKATFGDAPQDAAPEAREKGLQSLERAVRHFRSTLDIDPDHENARYNLETIRLWIKNMQDIWSERDKKQQREELDLEGFLAMLMKKQKLLRRGTLVLEPLEDSARRREVVRQTAQEQADLMQEIDPLEEKINAMFEQAKAQAAQAAQAGGAQAPDPSQMEGARSAFLAMAGRVRDAMKAAGDDLEGGLLQEATSKQQEAQSELENMWDSVSPFEKTLSQSIELEKGIVEGSDALLNRTPPDATSNEEVQPQGSQTNDESDTVASGRSPDVTEQESVEQIVSFLAEDQDRVLALVTALSMKASQSLTQLPESLPEAPAGQPETEEEKKAREEQAAQLEGIRTSYQKAIESGPKLSELAGSSAAALRDERFEEAHDDAKQLLDLLEEIAKTLPKQQNQDQQGEDQQNQDQDQQNQDQQEQDQQNQDEQNQDQPNEDEQNKDQQGKESNPQDLSKEQAEALLRRAEEREREAKEKRRAIQALLGRAKVDRDW